MGCDINIFAEVRKSGKWKKVENHFSIEYFDMDYFSKDKSSKPFGRRNYSIFAFFADIRNYDHCEPISALKGLPDDSEFLNSDDTYDEPLKKYIEENINYRGLSYLTLKELIEFDYDKTFLNRRIMKETSPGCWNGAAIGNDEESKMVTYRENLGEWYFVHLEELKTLGEPDDVRIIFWFF